MSRATTASDRPTPDAAQLSGRSYAEYATEVLRDRLIVLDIPPGTPINDDAVGRELGIGRTPVREALKRLESEHLVTVFPRRGTFAAPVDITDLASITEMRVVLEPLAASRASLNASPNERTRMRSLAHALETLDLGATSPADLMVFDLEVHRSIYSASGNKHLEEDLLKYGNLATRIWCMVIHRLGDVSEHVGEHVSLLRDIADGHAAKAARYSQHHVAGFERLVRSALYNGSTI